MPDGTWRTIKKQEKDNPKLLPEGKVFRWADPRRKGSSESAQFDYEFNDENREAALLSAIEEKYPNCIAINYNYRDLTDYKGKFVAKGDDIEDYGYAYEKWTDSVMLKEEFVIVKERKKNFLQCIWNSKKSWEI